MGVITHIKGFYCGYDLVKWVCLGIIAVFLCGEVTSVQSQNNPYKIRDELYPIYQRGAKYRVSAEGLRIADSLFAEAVRLNDKKAQCLALVIPTYYYVSVAKYGELQ